jgi:hypothetical protein
MISLLAVGCSGGGGSTPTGTGGSPAGGGAVLPDGGVVETSGLGGTGADPASGGRDGGGDAAAGNGDGGTLDSAVSAAAGGAGGSTAGAAGGSTATVCSPCNMMYATFLVDCGAGSGACIQQNSDTVDTDGTTTSVDNDCRANGTKDLKTTTTSPADGGVKESHNVVQHFSHGALCYTAEGTSTMTSSGMSSTSVVKNAAGGVVATLTIDVVLAGGQVTETEMISCGGTPEPWYPACVILAGMAADPNPDAGSGAIGTACVTGTCM